jgi:endonuclease YncB( thermonuclease family)
VIVVYPPAPAPQFVGGGYGETALAAAPGPPQPAAPASDQQGSQFVPASYYLIAYKDHTIYSAVAYWVEGDTLHYFTTGATHNQVSLSLVDRDLTQRLNEEAGNNLQLPKN